MIQSNNLLDSWNLEEHKNNENTPDTHHISRRWFMMWWVALAASTILASNEVSAQSVEMHPSYVKAIPQVEWDGFVNYFTEAFILYTVKNPGLENPWKDFIRDEVQGNILNFWEWSRDGVLGPYTSRMLYERHFFPIFQHIDASNDERWFQETFTFLQQNKLLTMDEMQNYPNWRRPVREKGRVVTLRNSEITYNNIFDTSYYFWPEWEPQSNNYINRSIAPYVHANISERNGLKGYIRKLGERYISLLYLNGELKLASYTSPGSVERYGPNALTQENIYGNMSFQETPNDPDHLTAYKHYISGWADSLRYISPKLYRSAPMPYAVRVDDTRSPEGLYTKWVYTHAWVTNGHPLSHECLRHPLYYARGIYELFRRHGSISWDTRYSQWLPS